MAALFPGTRVWPEHETGNEALIVAALFPGTRVWPEHETGNKALIVAALFPGTRVWPEHETGNEALIVGCPLLSISILHTGDFWLMVSQATHLLTKANYCYTHSN